MPSFQITIADNRRAAGRFVAYVRRELLMALFKVKGDGITQSEIARRLNVHRSVISREFRGLKDMTLGRVGELAWAMGYRIRLVFEKVEPGIGVNAPPRSTVVPVTTTTVTVYREGRDTSSSSVKNLDANVQIFEAA